MGQCALMSGLLRLMSMMAIGTQIPVTAHAEFSLKVAGDYSLTDYRGRDALPIGRLVSVNAQPL